MKKIIIIGLLLIAIFFIGCSSGTYSEPQIYDLPDDEEIFACETDADCGHIRGCNEDGGSPCINVKFTQKYGFEKRNCDPENVGFCYTCECVNNRCQNILDTRTFGC